MAQATDGCEYAANPTEKWTDRATVVLRFGCAVRRVQLPVISDRLSVEFLLVLTKLELTLSNTLFRFGDGEILDQRHLAAGRRVT